VRILFAGTADIGIPSLRYLLQHHDLIGVLTQPDRPAGRHRDLKPPAIKEELLRINSNIPLLQPETPRSAEVEQWVRKLAPEVIVTMAYGKIIPRGILNSPSVACLNIHASLLPLHRGASPIQAAIASGDKQSGITIMYMDEGLDTGDILLSKNITLRRRETSGSLSVRLSDLAPIALAEALEQLGKGKAPRVQQNQDAASACTKIGRQECMINWSLPARELEMKIRSLLPRPGAVASLPLSKGGFVTVKVHKCILASRTSGIPGTILRSDSRGILVACGKESLILVEIQQEGRGRMHASAFSRGVSLATGSFPS